MTRAREVAVALLLAAGIGTGLMAQAGSGSRGELDALAQKVDRVEALRRIKDLDRTFAQLAQFGEFKRMASLTSLSLETNGGMCRDLLRVRYAEEEGVAA